MGVAPEQINVPQIVPPPFHARINLAAEVAQFPATSQARAVTLIVWPLA